MAMPGLLYCIFSPGSNSSGARSRAIVNASFGGGEAFPEVAFPAGQLLVRLAVGLGILDAGGVRAQVPQRDARLDWIAAPLRDELGGRIVESDEAVASWPPPATPRPQSPWPSTRCRGVCRRPWPGAYHSQTMASLRMTSKAVVLRAARSLRRASSLAEETPWLSGAAFAQSNAEAEAKAAATTHAVTANQRAGKGRCDTEMTGDDDSGFILTLRVAETLSWLNRDDRSAKRKEVRLAVIFKLENDVDGCRRLDRGATKPVVSPAAAVSVTSPEKVPASR